MKYIRAAERKTISQFVNGFSKGMERIAPVLIGAKNPIIPPPKTLVTPNKVPEKLGEMSRRLV